MEKKERFYLIDGLRGLAIVSMIIYHFVWNLSNIAKAIPEPNPIFDTVWQHSICCSFILISGFCFHLSRHPLKNGLLALMGGIIVSVVTINMMPESPIYFGVLIFHGTAMLFSLPFRKWLYKIPPFVGIAASVLLFLFGYSLEKGSLAFGLVKLPESLYQNMFTAFWGMPHESFYSADYFPFFPWIFLFLTGFFLCSFVKSLKKAPNFLYFRLPLFEWLGRYSLIIYLAHQPILYAITLLF